MQLDKEINRNEIVLLYSFVYDADKIIRVLM